LPPTYTILYRFLLYAKLNKSRGGQRAVNAAGACAEPGAESMRFRVCATPWNRAGAIFPCEGNLKRCRA